MSHIDDVKDYLTSLQNRICAELESVDGTAMFARDAWKRPGGGGGESGFCRMVGCSSRQA